MFNRKTLTAGTAAALAVAFIACILLANYVTTEYEMVPVGFGLTATAGTYLAGLTFVLRDSIQDAARSLIPPRREVHYDKGKAFGLTVDPRSDWYAAAPVLVLIALGAGLSFIVSDPFIAMASAVAFGCAELCDLLIYTPMRRKGYLRAALASNLVGAFVDTVLFLWIAGFPIADAIAGQMVGKLAVTGVAALLVLVYRARRQAVIA